jgi:hypothetical protein
VSQYISHVDEFLDKIKDISIKDLSDVFGLSQHTLWNIKSGRVAFVSIKNRNSLSWLKIENGFKRYECHKCLEYWQANRPIWFGDFCKQNDIKTLDLANKYEHLSIKSHKIVATSCKKCFKEIFSEIRIICRKDSDGYFGSICKQCHLENMSAKAIEKTKYYTSKDVSHVINRLYRSYLGKTNATALIGKEKGKDFVSSLYESINDEANKDDVPNTLRPFYGPGGNRILDHCHETLIPRRYISNSANCAEGFLRKILSDNCMSFEAFFDKFISYLNGPRNDFDFCKNYIGQYLQKGGNDGDIRNRGEWFTYAHKWQNAKHLPNTIETYIRKNNENRSNYAAFIALQVELKNKAHAICAITEVKENLALDHCHILGTVRGWISKDVNSLEGFIRSIAVGKNCSFKEVMEDIRKYWAMPLSDNFYLNEAAKTIKTYKKQ